MKMEEGYRRLIEGEKIQAGDELWCEVAREWRCSCCVGLVVLAKEGIIYRRKIEQGCANKDANIPTFSGPRFASEREKQLETQIANYKTMGICSLATENVSVRECMKHWEGRAEKAERELAASRERNDIAARCIEVQSKRVQELEEANNRLGIVRDAIKSWNKQELSDGAALIAISTIIYPQPPLTPEVIAKAKELEEQLRQEKKI